MRNRYVLLLDILFFVLTPGLAILIRLEGTFPFDERIHELINAVLLLGGTKLFVFGVGGLYQGMWEHASIGELSRILLLGVVLCVLQTVLFHVIKIEAPDWFQYIPRSVALLDAILATAFVGLIRFNVRLSASFEKRYPSRTVNRSEYDPVLIVGAGDAGVMVVDEILSNPQLQLKPIGFVDDDKRKHKLKVRGLSVFGGRAELSRILEKGEVKKVIIAMPTTPGSVIREIGRICGQFKVEVKTVPGVFELIDGRIRVNKLRNIAIEDLLRREPAKIDVAELRRNIDGKRVLVTGAGGSIGGELCRQVAGFGPVQLILVGHGENSIFNISAELNQEHPGTMITSVIGDIRDFKRMQSVVTQYKPHIIYHAAAHKHVSLMELNPSEAVTNNITGTLNMVQLALENSIERFVLISTDKAVKPANVMGATKRVAELIVQAAAKKANRPFVAVRFGNVLGSRGSVIPIFKEQIAAGRPITVTHPDVKRYFMTIPEAVQLVLQASVIGAGGEIFVLDMGKPVKIVDLAEDLIRLSGLESGKDVDIVFTGLKQGEKLFEELVFDDEHFENTSHSSIYVLRNGSKEKGKKTVPQATLPILQEQISLLTKFAERGNANEIRSSLNKLVGEAQLQIPDVPI